MASAPAATAAAADVEDIERRRQALQDSTAKLRTLLQEWRLWDVEYEALKEEVSEARGRADLVRIRRDFEGRLVNGKEVAEIFGAKLTAVGPDDTLKTAEQIVNQLDRRIDYVQRNIESLERQVEQAEDRAAAADDATAAAVYGDGQDAMPIMDIVEELDDDDNVVSFTVQRPGETEFKVSEALKKAGVELKQDDGDELEADEVDAVADHISAGKQPSKVLKGLEAPLASKPGHGPAHDAPVPGKKGVLFSQDTKPAAENDKATADTQKMHARAQGKIEAIMRQAKEQEQMGTNPPVIPDDESDDDAKLRRDMLAYSMNEIGPVVAELELEEADSDDDDDDHGEKEDYGYYDDDDNYDDDDDDDDDEDEDEDDRGRSRRSALSGAYRKRMLELEKKLGVGRQSLVSAASSQSENQDDAENHDEPRVGRIAIRSNPAVRPKTGPPPASAIKTSSSAPTTKPAAKKGVRFAEEIDIADEPEGAPLAAPHKPVEGTMEPVSDIVERVPTGPRQAPRKFLDTVEPNVAPSGPEGRTIADAVLERDPKAKPREPSEFDADLLHQEAAVEYHRLRNKMIQKEGGFVKEQESAIEPLDESEGGPKRMSRFKAARLGRA